MVDHWLLGLGECNYLSPNERIPMRKETLVSRVSTGLRASINTGEYAPGHRLPTETELATQYGVSRPTLRNALRQLETQGLIRTQHGVGSFVSDQPQVKAGLERLDSITDSIRAGGHTPGMEYQSRTIRPALPEEAQKMGLSPVDQVLELRRSILSDGEVVAFSYDLMPIKLFPDDFDPGEFQGSIFEHLRNKYDLLPHHSFAEVHAVNSRYVGWGPEAQTHSLYILLDQLHYDTNETVLVYSQTYFIEGRYVFSLVRTRS